MPRPSRSLFASLPYDLKRTLKSQTVQSLPSHHSTYLSEDGEGVSVEVKQEKILELSSRNGFISTQPPSPTKSADQELVDLTEEVEKEGPSENQLNGGHTGSADDSGSRSANSHVAAIPSSTHRIAAAATHALSNGSTPSGSKTVAPFIHKTSGPSKRPFEVSSSPFSTPPSRKKRKGKSKAPANSYHDHPWDCTGLVPRYTDYSEVPSDLTKYFAQRHLYFPLYDSLPLLLDDIGWYSITPQPIAAHIADRCTCDVIIDAFCGVGGNSIEFARTCERVIAIDNDPTRLRLARHNALHSGVADRIEFILADFTDFARAWKSRTGGKDESIDVIFLSPPWGGPEYLTFTAGNADSTVAPAYPLSAILPIPGDELFEIASDLSPNIAYFLPRNTDMTELSSLAPKLEKARLDGSKGGKRAREWVEVEEEWVGDKLKAITAYFGGLVSE